MPKQKFVSVSRERMCVLSVGLETRDDVVNFVRAEALAQGFTPTKSQVRYRVKQYMEAQEIEPCLVEDSFEPCEEGMRLVPVTPVIQVVLPPVIHVMVPPVAPKRVRRCRGCPESRAAIKAVVTKWRKSRVSTQSVHE